MGTKFVIMLVATILFSLLVGRVYAEDQSEVFELRLFLSVEKIKKDGKVVEVIRVEATDKKGNQGIPFTRLPQGVVDVFPLAGSITHIKTNSDCWCWESYKGQECWPKQNCKK